MNIIKKYHSLSPGFKAILWYSFCSIAERGISVLVVPIYTRLLSTTEYGTYSVFISWMELFEYIVTLRLFADAYMVGLVKFEEDRSRYTASVEKLCMLIVTIFFGIYLLFQNQINSLTQLTTPLMILLFVMLYAISAFAFWKGWQRVDNKYIQMVAATLAIAVLTPVVTIIGITAFRNDALSVIIARVGVHAFAAIVITFFFFTNQLLYKIDWKYCKYALLISIPLIPFYISNVVLNHSDRIMIQRFAGTAAAGIYSVAYSGSMIMKLFGNAIHSSLQPWLFKHLKKEEYGSIPNVVNGSVLFVAVLNLLLIAFAPELISILAPKEYIGAIWIVPPLAGSVFVIFVYQYFVNVEFYYGESTKTTTASIGAALLNVVLNLLLLPKIGYIAAGYTTLVSYVSFLIAHYFTVKKVCKKNNCSMSIFSVRTLCLISIGFTVISVILGIGYIYTPLRYITILLAFVLCIIHRNRIKNMIVLIASSRKTKIQDSVGGMVNNQ